MLFRKTRKLFENHNWVELEKAASNRSQKLKRIKNQSITGLEELALIADKIPEAIQDEIFTSRKLEPLVDKILKLESSLSHGPSVNRVDARRTQLCAMLINKCIGFLKLQYDFLEHDSPGLTAIVLEQLDRAGKISSEIANKVELLNLRNVATKTKLEYLFDWNNITEKHEKLWSYLYGELDTLFFIGSINRNGGALHFDLLSEFDEVISTVTVNIISENKATLMFTKGSTKIERELVVRKENDELYVFRKLTAP